MLLEDDLVFRSGEINERMIFLRRGYIQLGDSKRSTVYATKGPGSCLGELMLFQTGVRHTTSAWSISDCVIYTLSQVDFRELFCLHKNDYNDLYKRLRTACFASCKIV